MIAVPQPTLVEPRLDYIAILSDALTDAGAREQAALLFADWAANQTLAADHGAHVVRPSSMGRCSLEMATDALGLHDLPQVSAAQLMMDEGTMLGAWFGALLDASLTPGSVELEARSEYRGTAGHIDALISADDYVAFEVLEIKTTPSTGALKPPHVAKPMQCLQAATYALGCDARTFALLTIGYNVGLDRSGVPHPKMRLDTYFAEEWRSAVDAEIDRMTAVAARSREDVLSHAAELADTTDAWRCGFCRFSACPKNTNPARFAL